MFFFLYTKNFTKQINSFKPSYNNNFENVLKYKFFDLPVRKKSIIFLRAPYKNKLARLTILRLEYSAILSIKRKIPLIKNFYHGVTSVAYLYCLSKWFAQYNLSTHRVKHTKTTAIIDLFLPQNFIFNNYL